MHTDEHPYLNLLDADGKVRSMAVNKQEWITIYIRQESSNIQTVPPNQFEEHSTNRLFTILCKELEIVPPYDNKDIVHEIIFGPTEFDVPLTTLRLKEAVQSNGAYRDRMHIGLPMFSDTLWKTDTESQYFNDGGILKLHTTRKGIINTPKYQLSGEEVQTFITYQYPTRVTKV